MTQTEQKESNCPLSQSAIEQRRDILDGTSAPILKPIGGHGEAFAHPTRFFCQKTSEGASALFRRTTYYPVAMFVVILLGALI